MVECTPIKVMLLICLLLASFSIGLSYNHPHPHCQKWVVILTIRYGYLSCNIAIFCNYELSRGIGYPQGMMSVYLKILLVILPYLTEVVTYTTPLYYTYVLKCNGGVPHTHVCSQHNNYVLHTFCIPRQVVVM